MSAPTQAEELVVVKCGACSLFKRGLTQAEAIAFREVHKQHEGNALYAEEAAPALATAFAPVAAAERLNKMAEALGTQAEHARGQLRSVASTDEAEQARLQSQHADEVRVALPLTFGALDSLLVTVDQARALVAEVTPPLTAALDRLAAARREGVQGLEDLRTVGDLVHERLSQERDDLVHAQQAMDRVHRALKRLEPIVPVFKTFLARFVRAASARLAQHEVAWATARIAAIAAELAQLRLPGHTVREATVLATRAAALTGEGVSVPTLVWPAELLAPPTLTDS